MERTELKVGTPVFLILNTGLNVLASVDEVTDDLSFRTKMAFHVMMSPNGLVGTTIPVMKPVGDGMLEFFLGNTLYYAQDEAYTEVFDQLDLNFKAMQAGISPAIVQPGAGGRRRPN